MNQELEKAMEAASYGSLNAAEQFYNIFLKSQLIYLNRFQKYPLSSSPNYPNDFFNILGVQDYSRVVIPIFTNPSYIDDWSGTDFSYQETMVKDLLSRIPNDWWIVINPGQNIEKELSPWEIDLLKGGEDAIAEIIDELTDEIEQVPLTLLPTSEDELTELKISISEFGKNTPNIVQILIAKEVINEQAEEKKEKEVFPHSHILIGIETHSISVKERMELREKAIKHIAPLFIGKESPKFYISDVNSPSSMIGMFIHIEPTYFNEKLLEEEL